MTPASKVTSNTPFWKRFVSVAAFVAGALLLLFILNTQGGEGRIREDIWFTPLAGNGTGRTADAIFIGTSRVSASIETSVFDQILSQVLHRSIRSANLGVGGSTTAEYAMGLRRLHELNPDAIRGSVAFIEAPMGLADYQTWEESWVVDQAPELMSRYLTSEDLPRLLFHSRTPVAQKAIVAANVLFGTEENLSRLRKNFQGWLDKASLPLVSSLLPLPSDDSSSDLATGGGILGDRKSVAAARELAISHVAEQMSNQQPERDWDSSTMYTVVQRLRELGAQPIFYEMPLSRTMAAVYETPVRTQDRAYFQGVMKRWGVPYLAPPLATTDEDFPDIWHLRKSRATEFTQALTREFLVHFVLPAMSAASSGKTDSIANSK